MLGRWNLRRLEPERPQKLHGFPAWAKHLSALDSVAYGFGSFDAGRIAEMARFSPQAFLICASWRVSVSCHGGSCFGRLSSLMRDQSCRA